MRSNAKLARRVMATLLSALCVIGAVVFLMNALGPQTPSEMRDENWSFVVSDKASDSAEAGDVEGAEDAEDESPVVLVSDSGAEYAANRVLLSFDGSTDEHELCEHLSKQGVGVTDVSLVSKALENNKVLVVVEYEGDEDPMDLADRLVGDAIVTSAEPDFLMSIDDVEDVVYLEPSVEPGSADSSDEGAIALDEEVSESADDEGAATDAADATSEMVTEGAEGVEGSAEAIPESVEEAVATDAGFSLFADQLLSPDASVNDPYYSKQWELTAAKATSAWNYSKSSGAVTVAVVDTGIDYDHADLKNNLVSSTYFKNTYTEKTGAAAVDDVVGHGTHVSGIIAARANNSKGVAGISHNAKVLPIKVSCNAEGKMYGSDIIEAIDYVISLKTSLVSPVDLRNIRVINMSLGGAGQYSSDFQDAIDRAYDAGILVVASAGNDAKYSTNYYPAAYDNVLAVSALKQTTTSTGYAFDSEYSNYGPYVDIAAPGTEVYSTVMSGSYGYMSGTSMATPVVSGVAALLYAQNMNLAPANVTYILQKTAVDLGASGWDNKTGYGAVDAYRAAYNRPIAYCTVASISDQAYTGKAITPKVTVKYGSATLVEGTDYTLSYSNNVSPGIAKVTITGKGRSAGSATVTFRILKKIDMSGVSFNNSTVTYDGEPHYLSVSGSLPSGVSVAYSGNGKVNAGTYTVTASFTTTASYCMPIDSKTAKLVIEPASILNCRARLVSKHCYTGEAVEPSITVLHGNTELVEGADYTLSYEDNVEIGTGRIVVSGCGNFTGRGVITFDIVSNCYAFTDTPANAWYVTGGALDYVVANGIMTGKTATTFAPLDNLTRAEVAMILYRLADEPAVKGSIESFSDVTKGRWYYDAVMWARSAGVISGYGNGKFGPTDLVTREQLAKMLCGYAAYRGFDVSADLAAAQNMADWRKVSSWARSSVAWAVGEGVLNGSKSGSSYYLKPGNSATRAEAAKMVMVLDSGVLKEG